ncbi:MAG: LamG-like jellyroll fold domain-containing protein, partial [Verrucomicrobiota bacterium]
TTDLRGRSGVGHGNVHWSGNFDEIQDFEHDIRGPFGGNGFLTLTPQQFAAQHPSPASGKSGLSAELDALAAYVTSLTPAHTPRSPHRNSNGTLTAAALRGRDVFIGQNCAACHGGDALTGGPLGPVNLHPLVNVGTQSALSGSRLGQPLIGIDTPTLHGLHAARGFLHHGQASTLDEVFNYAGGTLRLANQGQLLTTVNTNAAGIYADDPTQGGGGSVRGILGGVVAFIGDEAGALTPPGIRFGNLDGGPAGGPARIALRYVRQYNNGTALLRINGTQQTLNVLRQYPDSQFHASGWRWIVVDAPLNAGLTNTIEVLRGNGDLQVNALLVSSAADLATAQPHRLVQGLAIGDRNDLLAYLQQVDGRDALGAPLPPPAPPAPQVPSIVSAPSPQVLALGNTLNFTVAVGGTGPFGFQWYRGDTPVGGNSPMFEIAAVQNGDAGAYRVMITNGPGSISTNPVQVTINPALEITTALLPSAPLERSYDRTLTAIGGVSQRTWSLESGSLPLGLTLSASGRITGVPTAPARAEFTVRVSDFSGSATRTLTLDAPPAGGFVSDPDLILHYSFDEGSGTRVWDSAPAGLNHSSDVIGAHWVADGRFGGAYGPANTAETLNGFFPANQSDLDFNPRAESFTVSVWVRTTDSAGYNTILGKDRNVEPFDVQYRIWMNGSPNGIQAINGNQFGGTLTTTLPALNDGQWHLVTLVNYLEGATWRSRLYYNDGTAFTQFNTGANGRVPGLLRIGNTTRSGNPWIGQIDELRIYRRALSQSEIAVLFNTPGSETFNSWLNTILSPDQLADPALRAPGGDANGNGVPNLIEFATGSNVLQPLTLQLTGEPGNQTAQLTLLRNSAARGVTLTVESTEDFVTWSPLATSVNGGVPSGSATINEGSAIVRLLRIETPANGSRSAYRLRAVLAQ